MDYDLIVVGSGNAACGFLSKYLPAPGTASQRILVLEEGQDFFAASDLAHENNWIRSFSQSNIFKLRNASTKNDVPIITARAVCQGGGGTINYTMIHEEDEWLSKNIGKDNQYWNVLKVQLNEKFKKEGKQFPDNVSITAVADHLLEVTKKCGYKETMDYTHNFPNFNTKHKSAIHRFPTPFNRFGQRTASGVSIVDWCSPNLELRTRSKVTNILFEDSTGTGNEKVCVGVQVLELDIGVTKIVKLNRNGRLVLAAGSSTPQLLLPHKDALNNAEIGTGASDHILLPLGLYVLPDDMPVVGKDIYLPLFATGEWKGSDERRREYGFDFHSGEVRKLIFMLAHLFLAFLLPNNFKRILIRRDIVFRILTNVIRVLLEAIVFVLDVLRGVHNKFIGGRPWSTPVKLITATLKFQPGVEGKYIDNSEDNAIQLGWFDAPSDAQLAKDALTANMDMLNALGTQPPWIIRKLLWFFVRMPYTKEDVAEYVDTYKRKFLLSQLHLSGGCNIGKALHQADGRVKGAQNVYVADLSAVPLPRVSTQMTAYLMGFHIANAFVELYQEEQVPRTVVTEVQVDTSSSKSKTPADAADIAVTGTSEIQNVCRAVAEEQKSESSSKEEHPVEAVPEGVPIQPADISEDPTQTVPNDPTSAEADAGEVEGEQKIIDIPPRVVTEVEAETAGKDPIPADAGTDTEVKVDDALENDPSSIGTDADHEKIAIAPTTVIEVESLAETSISEKDPPPADVIVAQQKIDILVTAVTGVETADSTEKDQSSADANVEQEPIVSEPETPHSVRNPIANISKI